METLLLTDSDRTCWECGGDGRDEFKADWLDDECDRCHGKGYITEEDNENIDLRPYMKPAAFRRFLMKHYPSNRPNYLPMKTGPTIYNPDTPIGIETTVDYLEWRYAPRALAA